MLYTKPHIPPVFPVGPEILLLGLKATTTTTTTTAATSTSTSTTTTPITTTTTITTTTNHTNNTNHDNHNNHDNDYDSAARPQGRPSRVRIRAAAPAAGFVACGYRPVAGLHTIYIYVYTSLSLYIYIYIYMPLSLYIYICMCICMYICICVIRQIALNRPAVYSRQANYQSYYHN